MIIDAPAVELTEYDSRLVERVRELNSKAPISVRLPLNENAGSSAAKMARDGVDVIHAFADYHGRAWESHNPRFVKDLIRSVHGALVKESLRDEITLIASGGITLAEHVPKAIACGADLVALDTTILVALQARFEGKLAPPGNGRIRPERFDQRWGEQRLVNLVGAWHDQLIEILSAMGMRDVRRLRGDVGRAMFKEDLEKEAFSDIIQRA
jgi:glutamate synthase domain-containing protein 2